MSEEESQPKPKQKQKQKHNPKQKKKSLIERWNEEMNLIEQKTGIKGIYVVIGLIVCIFLVYKNIFDTVITNLVGTFYPAFMTIKSIEKNDDSEEKYWLTYWAVFGFFILIDMFSPIIVKFIPFYLIFKIIFLIWLFLPGTNGCKFFYNKVVKKILIRYVNKWDIYFHKVGINMGNIRENINKNFERTSSINRTMLDRSTTSNNDFVEEKEEEDENNEHND